MQTPTQGTPAGCVIGTIGLFPFIFACMGGWGLLKWIQLPVVDRHFDEHFRILAGSVAGGILLTVFFFWLSIRVLRRTDFRGYNSRDSVNGEMKW